MIKHNTFTIKLIPIALISSVIAIGWKLFFGANSVEVLFCIIALGTYFLFQYWVLGNRNMMQAPPRTVIEQRMHPLKYSILSLSLSALVIVGLCVGI